MFYFSLSLHKHACTHTRACRGAIPTFTCEDPPMCSTTALAGHGFTAASVAALGAKVGAGPVPGLVCDTAGGWSSGSPPAGATCSSTPLALSVTSCQRQCNTGFVQMVAGTPYVPNPTGGSGTYPLYNNTPPVPASSVINLAPNFITPIPGSPNAFLFTSDTRGLSLLKLDPSGDPSLHTIQRAVPDTWKYWSVTGWNDFGVWRGGIVIDPDTLDVYVSTGFVVYRLNYPGGPASGSLPTKTRIAGCVSLGANDPETRSG